MHCQLSGWILFFAYFNEGVDWYKSNSVVRSIRAPFFRCALHKEWTSVLVYDEEGMYPSMCLALVKMHHALVVKTLGAELQHTVQARATAVGDIWHYYINVIFQHNFTLETQNKA